MDILVNSQEYHLSECATVCTNNYFFHQLKLAGKTDRSAVALLIVNTSFCRSNLRIANMVNSVVKAC